VVFRTGVKPVRGLFRLLGVVALLCSLTSTPSDVNIWAGTASSPSSGAARFLPATTAVGSGSRGLGGVVFASSGVFARNTDGARRPSGVLLLTSAEGPDMVRGREGEPDGTAETGGDDLCVAGPAKGCLRDGLSFEVEAVCCAGS
jgi:hypothetical protein